jgi:predicted HicB family RNase H-like nuclease
MDLVAYKGYGASVEYSEDDQCLVGRVAGIRDVVGFHGNTESEVRAAFREAVDEYLATCEKLGKTPDRPSWDSWFDGVKASPDFMAVREQADE